MEYNNKKSGGLPMKYLKDIENYTPKLNLLETEIAIKFVKDTFERRLAESMALTRVSAPLFVSSTSGINDYLNGWEKVIKFKPLALDKELEIVQSLAKWKRVSLKKYNFQEETGLYTDMNAIRKDEDLDAIHSLYVDQWDWEKVIKKEERNLNYLKEIVEVIYKVIVDTLNDVKEKFPSITTTLPNKIHFITSEELLKMYPNANKDERENAICKKYQAVFIIGIGKSLSNGLPHDSRAADYDDWNLNGDIVVWNHVINHAFELSSMGIRVDDQSLIEQLTIKNELDKLNNEYCQKIINHELPLTMGGGIGQSRLCMLMLEKAHIGEVQVSTWSDTYLHELEKKNIHLL